MALTCSMCEFQSNEMALLVQHLVRRHQFDNRFSVTCNVEECGATYRIWASYKTHLQRHHPDMYHEPAVEAMEVQAEENDPAADAGMYAYSMLKYVLLLHIIYILSLLCKIEY